MKKLIKISGLLIVLLIALILNPNFSNASTSVNSEEELRNAIDAVEEDGVIELSDDISLKKPIEISNKDITINGNGHTITKHETEWSRADQNGTLITAGGKGAVVTLNDLKLIDGDKYGAQSYNGGQLVLDGVTISGCGFGGVLVNAGTVEVRDLTLGRNGGEKNNGIEIAKGKIADTEDNMPTLLMNGTLTSSEDENVVYVAINDQLSKFEVQNTDSTTNKIFVTGNKVVVTDENNVVLYESNETDKQIVSLDQYANNVTITLSIDEETIDIIAPSGSTITKEDLDARFNLADLGLSEYKVDGYYTDADFTNEFHFENSVAANVTIYVKLSLIEEPTPETSPSPTTPETTETPATAETPATTEQDETPKTGYEGYVGIAFSIFVVSVIGIAVLNKMRA